MIQNEEASTSRKPISCPRNKQRFEKKREQMSVKTDQDNRKILSDKLFFGCNIQPEAMYRTQLNKISRGIILPISTRGLGFINRYLMQRFSRLNVKNLNFHDLSASLYRVSLCMLEIKIMQTMQNQMSLSNHVNFEQTFIPYDIIQAIGTLGVGFQPILNLISCVGILRAYDTTFLPRFLLAPMFDDGFPVCDPTLVTFSRLREYVEALSNSLTPQVTRQWFYEHNAIPCAIWNQRVVPRHDAEGQQVVDDSWPLLQNPNHIMPESYDRTAVLDDVNLIRTSLDIINRKYPKYVCNGRVNNDGLGMATQLVSNDISDIRCSDLAVIPNYGGKPLTGNITSFWSNEVILDHELCMGMLHLVKFPKNTTTAGVCVCLSPERCQQIAII